MCLRPLCRIVRRLHCRTQNTLDGDDADSGDGVIDDDRRDQSNCVQVGHSVESIRSFSMSLLLTETIDRAVIGAIFCRIST